MAKVKNSMAKVKNRAARPAVTLGQRMQTGMLRALAILYFGALIFTSQNSEPIGIGALGDNSCCSWPPPGVSTVAQGQAIDADSSAAQAPSTKMFSAAPREGFQALTFNELASTELTLDQDGACKDVRLSSALTALDGEKVALAGFVIPTQLTGDQMTEFLLVPNQLACCFGQPLQLNQWVEMKAAQPLDCVTDSPISVYGVLHASPQRSGSVVTGIYQMDAQLLSTETQNS
jgi:hypothetical protein